MVSRHPEVELRRATVGVLLVHLVAQIQGCGVGLKENNQRHLRSIGGLQLELEAPGPE
jgi:hypothetical protein